jgi:hypothetical protein
MHPGSPPFGSPHQRARCGAAEFWPRKAKRTSPDRPGRSHMSPNPTSPQRSKPRRHRRAQPKQVDVAERAERTVLASLDVLDRCSRRVANMLDDDMDGEYDIKLASHLSWLSLQVARTRGELARVAERERRRAEKLTEREVTIWLRARSPVDRAFLMRRVEELDGGDSVLRW